MKKRFLILLTMAVCLFLLICVSAQADQVINPYRRDMLESLQKVQQRMRSEEAGNVWDADISVSIYPSNPVPGDTVTFWVNGIENASNKSFRWGVIDRRDDRYMYYNREYVNGKTSFQYKFYYSGTYYCYVSVNDGNYASVELTIKNNGSVTLEEKCKQIANSCKASTQWQTALNLYDWLTENTYYDSTLQYYGADMIFSGYGVCDGYAKAYMLLCKAAGITIERVENPDHAWNALVLGGKWYQADSTWDSGSSYPPGQGIKKDGGEGHTYFCLSSEIMQSIDAHSVTTGPHAYECKDMAANYYVHQNLWQSWGDYNWSLENGSYVLRTNRWVDQVASAFNNGETSFEFSAMTPYHEVNGKTEYAGVGSPIANGIVRYGLARTPFSMYGEEIKVSVSGTVSSNSITVKLKGWNLTEKGTLKLPALLKKIPVSGFENISSTTVIVPKGCSAIQSRAFANSGVRTITIPSTVTEIAADAFYGCGRIIVKTEIGSKAEEYALQKGMIVLHP